MEIHRKRGFNSGCYMTTLISYSRKANKIILLGQRRFWGSPLQRLCRKIINKHSLCLYSLIRSKAAYYETGEITVPHNLTQEIVTAFLQSTYEVQAFTILQTPMPHMTCLQSPYLLSVLGSVATGVTECFLTRSK